MNNLSKLRGSEHQPDFIRRLNIPRYTVPLLSLIESGLINPTPEHAQKIAKAVSAAPLEIWSASDLDYGVSREQANKSTGTLISADTHKLKDSVRCRVPPELKSQLRKCFESDGFTTESAFLLWWITVYIKRKTAIPGRTDTAAKENIT